MSLDQNQRYQSGARKENKGKQAKHGKRVRLNVIEGKTIELPEHQNVVCASCTRGPIRGPRFMCKQCQGFFLCKQCEMNVQHPHPFVKIVKHGGEGLGNHNRPGHWHHAQRSEEYKAAIQDLLTCENPLEIRQKVRNLGRQSFALKIHEHSTSPNLKGLLSNARQRFNWTVENSGTQAWPEGSRIVLLNGNVNSEPGYVQCVQPGQQTDIAVELETPGENLKIKAIWQLETPDGRRIGKLRLKGITVDPEVYELMRYGIKENIAKRIKEMAGDNLGRFMEKLRSSQQQ